MRKRIAVTFLCSIMIVQWIKPRELYERMLEKGENMPFIGFMIRKTITYAKLGMAMLLQMRYNVAYGHTQSMV